jgi:hypothetical protein
MLDSVVSQQPGPDGGAAPPISASFSGASSAVQAKTPDQFRFDQQLLEQLSVIKQKELDTNMRKEGTVTVEELGEVKDEGSEEDDGASNEDYDN